MLYFFTLEKNIKNIENWGKVICSKFLTLALYNIHHDVIITILQKGEESSTNKNSSDLVFQLWVLQFLWINKNDCIILGERISLLCVLCIYIIFYKWKEWIELINKNEFFTQVSHFFSILLQFWFWYYSWNVNMNSYFDY